MNRFIYTTPLLSFYHLSEVAAYLFCSGLFRHLKHSEFAAMLCFTRKFDSFSDRSCIEKCVYLKFQPGSFHWLLHVQEQDLENSEFLSAGNVLICLLLLDNPISMQCKANVLMLSVDVVCKPAGSPGRLDRGWSARITTDAPAKLLFLLSRVLNTQTQKAKACVMNSVVFGGSHASPESRFSESERPRWWEEAGKPEM